MPFAFGHEVEWTSEAAGYSRTKRGTVVGVVPSGLLPDSEQFPSLYKRSGVGMPRSHESYVVKVKGRGLYWPRVKQLKAVDPGNFIKGWSEAIRELPLSGTVNATEEDQGRYDLIMVSGVSSTNSMEYGLFPSYEMAEAVGKLLLAADADNAPEWCGYQVLPPTKAANIVGTESPERLLRAVWGKVGGRLHLEHPELADRVAILLANATAAPAHFESA